MRLFSKCLATLALLAVAQLTQAQTFYSEDFANGFPTGWTTADGSGNNAVWTYCEGPSSACVNLYNGPEFASASADNGFMVMDSDEAGQLPTNHVSRLTTTAINCSAASQVFASFQTYIGIYTVGSANNVKLKVSTNGTTWTSYDVFAPLAPGGSFSANPFIANIDISATAANNATVYLQWEWTGLYEYWWFIDDLQLTSVDPTPNNDLTLSEFFYPLSSFETPASQIAADTFGFFGSVSNSGLEAQTNVKLKVEVFSSPANAIVFTDSLVIPVLEAGVDSFQMVLPKSFIPALPVGLYGIRYTVSSDNVDEIPADNVDGDFFRVSAERFAKENAPSTGSRPAVGGDYTIANIYRMSPDNLDRYKALGFEFTALVNAGETPLQDIATTAYLFRVSDDVAPDYSNFDGSEFLTPSLELRSLAGFEFPTGAVNSYTTLYPVELTDEDGNPGVDLDPGARYFAAMSYEGSSNTAFQASDDSYYYGFYSSVIFSNSWNLAGFGGDFNATIRMVIALSTSTDEKPLPESALKLFPNPVHDVLNLEVAFDQPTDASITIADMTGRVIKIDNRKAVSNEVITYQLSALPAGTYLARIATKEGTSTKKFVVVK